MKSKLKKIKVGQFVFVTRGLKENLGMILRIETYAGEKPELMKGEVFWKASITGHKKVTVQPKGQKATCVFIAESCLSESFKIGA